ncbi:hypothetical protein [Bradyrhizobium sp. sGM-13]|uniref:hypothetical protein n=1 Tax=Bradyrhizobium sp. sGM-13 TaxID=2831781 RepID=UPI001BCDBF7C|nr:hypothetical protein [Bradyrhizobium sp. sGM-13]
MLLLEPFNACWKRDGFCGLTLQPFVGDRFLLQKSVVADERWPVVSLTAIGFVRRLPGALYATLTLRNTRRMSGWRSRNQRREPL